MQCSNPEFSRQGSAIYDFMNPDRIVVGVEDDKCKEDDKAVYVLEEVFKDRQIIGIDSTDIIWGLGSFHCLSQQEVK